jgi:hypothetical protein
MIVKKVLLVASAATLMSTPALALPSQAPSNQGTDHAPRTTPVGPPSTTPNNTNNPGTANRSQKGDHGGEKDAGHRGNHGSDNPGHSNKPSPSGQSHQCRPHKVAYVASGTLVSQTLTKNADGTYGGELTVKVTHTNHHAAGDNGTTKAYEVENVHVTFGLIDTNNDGSVGLDDLKEGDRVRLIGKVTTLSRKCSQSGFTAMTTIRRIVFHAPPVAS